MPKFFPSFSILALSLMLLFIVAATANAAQADVQPIPVGGTLRGRFTERHYFLQGGEPLISTGSFLVAPGDGLIWNVESPAPLSFVVTQNGMNQNFGTMTLLHMSVARAPYLATLTQMLTNALSGHWSALDKDFTIKRKADAEGWRVILTPRPANRLPLKELTAKGGAAVDAAKLIRPDGGIDLISFSDQTVSAEPPTVAEAAAFEQVKP